MSAADRYFVDSNLLLYCVDPVDARKQARAREWMDALWVAGAGSLSWQVLHEFYWNAVRKMRLEPVRAREIVEDLAHWKPVDNHPRLGPTSLALDGFRATHLLGRPHPCRCPACRRPVPAFGRFPSRSAVRRRRGAKSIRPLPRGLLALIPALTPTYKAVRDTCRCARYCARESVAR